MRKFRRPVHVGTRVWAADEEGAKCLVAIPVFRGEVITRIALDCYAATRTAETNVDQPPVFSWVGGFMPYPFGTNSIGGPAMSTAQLDGWVQTLEAPGAGVYLGAEPNPGGDAGFVGADAYAQVNFRRHVIGDPMPVALDALGNADARFVDRFRTVIDKDLEATSHGMWLFGGRVWRMDAQTDFGVAELDNSATAAEIMGALRGESLSLATKSGELFWGGDNYIEADSFKETARRHFVIARPAIRISPAVGGPRST